MSLSKGEKIAIVMLTIICLGSFILLLISSAAKNNTVVEFTYPTSQLSQSQFVAQNNRYESDGKVYTKRYLFNDGNYALDIRGDRDTATIDDITFQTTSTTTSFFTFQYGTMEQILNSIKNSVAKIYPDLRYDESLTTVEMIRSDKGFYNGWDCVYQILRVIVSDGQTKHILFHVGYNVLVEDDLYMQTGLVTSDATSSTLKSMRDLSLGSLKRIIKLPKEEAGN